MLGCASRLRTTVHDRAERRGGTGERAKSAVEINGGRHIGERRQLTIYRVDKAGNRVPSPPLTPVDRPWTTPRAPVQLPPSLALNRQLGIPLAARPRRLGLSRSDTEPRQETVGEHTLADVAAAVATQYTLVAQRERAEDTEQTQRRVAQARRAPEQTAAMRAEHRLHTAHVKRRPAAARSAGALPTLLEEVP